jgi:hypothetical protein
MIKNNYSKINDRLKKIQIKHQNTVIFISAKSFVIQFKFQRLVIKGIMFPKPKKIKNSENKQKSLSRFFVRLILCRYDHLAM